MSLDTKGNHHSFTLMTKQIRFALLVPDREGLDYSIYLLRLFRKRHVHEQLSEGDIERLVQEIEAGHILPQRLEVELVTARGENPSDLIPWHSKRNAPDIVLW